MAPYSLTATLLLSVAYATTTTAADPLHVRIDAAIEAKAKINNIPLANLADDAEFLRRVYLDLAGTIPSVTVTRAFLADETPDKRAKLIDQLLAAPSYATRMSELFHVALMERLGDSTEWSTYLHDSFAKNKPYDELVREILRADSKNTANLGAAFWMAKRLENYGQNPVDYSGLTRDIGRLFLGKNFQCCECHDHLYIDEYKQKDFQGLHAFVRNTYLVNAAKLQVAEKPTTEKLSFASVFTMLPMATGPALPGLRMIEIPSHPKGMEYATPPDRKTNEPGVPKFSMLSALAEQLPNVSNRAFARNAVNRLWFAMMGRGLVHPLDLHHANNPPSHPELLDLMTDEFVSHKFDLKKFLRELALTKTYQRSSLLPAGRVTPNADYFAVALERRLSAEQLLAATLTATGNNTRQADSLRPKFLKAFANQPREPEDEIAPSLKGALFVLHDPAVLDLFGAKDGNLVARIVKLDDLSAAEELYLAMLSRKPNADESRAIARVLSKHREKRTEAVGRVAWALLASMEFGINH